MNDATILRLKHRYLGDVVWMFERCIEDKGCSKLTIGKDEYHLSSVEADQIKQALSWSSRRPNSAV